MNFIDTATIILYFLLTLAIGFWKGRGKRETSGDYFISKGTLPWWVICAAFITTGMNSEQLIGLNGMAYKIGLPILHLYLNVIIIYTLLVYVFLPVYMGNVIITMPEYLGKRFSQANADIFSVMLILSYIFLNLAVVVYGGAKLLEIVMGIDIWWGVTILGVVAGIYTIYGGMASAAYVSVIQFALIFIAGAVLFFLAYDKLPNGWNDVIANSPCGYHLIKATDYPEIPWHAAFLSTFGICIYYSCINQSLVQRCFGAKTQWDARMAIIIAGIFTILRPFVEVLPGLMCKAIGTVDPRFNLDGQSIDNVFPLLVRELIPAGVKGLILVGILSSVMSTISPLLNSISTLFVMDCYKKWIRPNAAEKELVKTGTIVTLLLTIFCIVYSSFVGKLGGSIFNYFQTGAAYFAVPVATVFILGFFWKRATPAAALFTLISGIPLGFILYWLIPVIVPVNIVTKYSLQNRYVTSGITEAVCILLFIVVSMFTRPKPLETIKHLMWNKSRLLLPANEPKRPWWRSSFVWWLLFVLLYIFIYYKLW